MASAIVDNGLENFYKHRTKAPERPQDIVPEFLQQARIFDHPTIQKSFVRKLDEDMLEATLLLEGITCAACVWLNEHHIANLPGVRDVQINYATRRAMVSWNNNTIQLSDIIKAIADIGYRAHPYEPSRQRELFEKERKQHLYRLGLAGLLGMQVMMIAVALYGGDWWGMQEKFRSFFYWVSLILTLPVVLYSAQPFFKSAWRDLKQRRTGMDLPVSLGILAAFTASIWTTLTGDGHVYYDSVVMFVFFLSVTRYLEFISRRKSLLAIDTLVQVTPSSATRINQDSSNTHDTIPVAELVPDDLVLVRPGETVPADGVIIEGNSGIDESLLTGESQPLHKQAGDQLIGGSINIESPVTLRIEKVGEDTVLSHMRRLLERAQYEKPALTRLADRIAGKFIFTILILASLVAIFWWQHDPQRWFSITLAVLVATCPCALSLAIPAATAAATTALTRLGLMTARANALETLARITHIVFDKTGTLTQGHITLNDSKIFSSLSKQQALEYAAALEQRSEHPIAKAFLAAAGNNGLKAEAIVNTPGHGVTGQIKGRTFVLGSPSHVLQHCSIKPSVTLDQVLSGTDTTVLLAEPGQLHAAFLLSDKLRDYADKLIAILQQSGINVLLYSGDRDETTQHIGEQLEITDNAYGGMTPSDKLSHMRVLQENGGIVAMVGDGINDAPVLAGADVSIAMGNGTHLALTSADLILLNDQLPNIHRALQIARKTRRIVRQNIGWAIGYNLLILPAAATGLIAPWMAAIGMSLSSLLVVANALRLNNTHLQQV